MDRSLIRDELRHGLTPGQIWAEHGSQRSVYLAAIEEEARLAGELDVFEPTEDVVCYLRDSRRFRWERIAARVFGDASKTAAAKIVYDQAKGAGAASKSYTGRGRKFPKMDDGAS